MEINIYQVDAFTKDTFGGNPAGVVPDAKDLTEENMEKIAREMNLSETAFIIPIDENNFEVRFFTPLCEVDLCGHATIGSFFTLAEKGYIRPITNGKLRIFQKTKAGILPVEIYYNQGKVERVMMTQSMPTTIGTITDIEELIDALNITEDDIGIEDKFVSPEVISTGLPDIMLPIKRKDILDNLDVDMKRLSDLSRKLKITGVHAFFLPDKDLEIVYTRNFAPYVGIDEEAATGTSNGALIYFLKKNGYLKGNEMISYQGEILNRPSYINCTIDETDEGYIVKVGGRARIVLEGIFCM